MSKNIGYFTTPQPLIQSNASQEIENAVRSILPECGGKRKRGPPSKVFAPKKRNVQDGGASLDGGGTSQTPVSTSSMAPPTRFPPLGRPPQRSYKHPNNNKPATATKNEPAQELCEDPLDEIFRSMYIPTLLKPLSEPTQPFGEEAVYENGNMVKTTDKFLSTVLLKRTELSTNLIDAEKILADVKSGIVEQENEILNLEKALEQAREAIQKSKEKIEQAKLERESAKQRLDDHQKMLEEIKSLFLSRFSK